jgi:hypothetical protein
MGDMFPTFRRTGNGTVRAAARTAPRLWKLTKKAAKVCVILIVLFLILHQTLCLIWGRQLKEKLNELKARGEPVTYSDLAAKPIPDSENGAVIYEKATKAINLQPSDPLTEFFSLQTTKNEKHLMIPKVRIMVKRNEQALFLAKQASEKRRCIFKLDSSDPLYIAISPRGWKLEQISKLINARAYLSVADGRTDDAVKDVVLSLRVAQARSEEPTIIGFGSQRSQIDSSLDILRDVDISPITPEQAKRIYEELSRISLQPSFLRALKGEKVQGISNFDDARSRSWDIGCTLGWDPSWIQLKLLHMEQDVERFAWRPLSYKDEQIYLALSDKRMKLAGRSYREIAMMPNNGVDLTGPGYAILTNYLSFNSSHLWCARDEAIAEIGLTQTAMALAVYKSRFGSYPNTLSELEKKVDLKIPDDVFSGKPFIYKRVGKGFLLYSVGWNLKDDGGRPKEQRKHGSDPNAFDIVWKSTK